MLLNHWRRVQMVNIPAMFLDLVWAVVLALYALIIGPLGILRGPIVIERAIWYLWVLGPQGLVSRSVRAAIDWRLGNFDSAITQLEGLVGANEVYYRKRPTGRARRRVLEDFYTVLARAYLHAGHIDDAMLVVIRAKKTMGVDRLAGLAELDAKTAHLVRAGLAAGRLLDGGGLATMFVKSHAPNPTPTTRQKAKSGSQGEQGRQGAVSRNSERRGPPTPGPPGEGSPGEGRVEAPSAEGRPPLSISGDSARSGVTDGTAEQSAGSEQAPRPGNSGAKIIPFPAKGQQAP